MIRYQAILKISSSPFLNLHIHSSHFSSLFSNVTPGHTCQPHFISGLHHFILCHFLSHFPLEVVNPGSAHLTAAPSSNRVPPLGLLSDNRYVLAQISSTFHLSCKDWPATWAERELLVRSGHILTVSVCNATLFMFWSLSVPLSAVAAFSEKYMLLC